MSIQHEHILNPVTALEFYHNGSALLILAGEGPYLKVFNADTSQLLSQCKVFEDQIIHGIELAEDVKGHDDLQLVIWGGPCLNLLRKSQFEKLLSQDASSITDAEVTISDWVLNVAISPSDSLSCALITAHNTVFRARLEGNRAPSVQTLSSPSRSILYSAHILWETDCHLLVAAGTVFGEIIVWKCNENGESQVLHTFTGHEGSIFGVNISAPFPDSSGSTGRLLASCSDDRTIRVWHISRGKSVDLHSVIPLVARETGFGLNETANSDDQAVAVVMAHASRIWRVKFLSFNAALEDGPASIDLLSFGEDAKTLHWRLYLFPKLYFQEKGYWTASTGLGSKRLSAQFMELDTFAYHSGKHIWSTAVQFTSEKTVVGTGGADGKISVYEIEKSILLEDTSEDESTWQLSPGSWNLKEILGNFETDTGISEAMIVAEQEIEEPQTSSIGSKPVTAKKKKAKKVPKDAFNRYAFVKENVILITTAFGRILRGSIGGRVHLSEIQLPPSTKEDLKSYTVVVGFPEISLAFFAGSNGRIYACNEEEKVLEVGNVEGKVADMFNVFDSITKTSSILVTTLTSAAATLFNIDSGMSSLSSETIFELPEKFIVTGAGSVNGILILGSRAGSLAFYDPSQASKPLQVQKASKGTVEDAITTIIPLPNADFNDLSFNFLTTGRNGLYNIYNLTRSTSTTVSLQKIHTGTPPFGPIIDHAWFDPTSHHLFLYGFKGKSFTVWNTTVNSEITSVDCGGAHRSYAYSPSGHFIYTKASRLYLHSHPPSSHRIIKAGGHGREIKSCAVSADQKLIATGAEDTSIRIWEYDDDTEKGLTSAVEVQKHTAGIQHLAWHGNDYLLSSGGNEEFFIWAVTLIPDFGIGVVCEATCPDQTAERDLRIMHFDVSALPDNDQEQKAVRMLISLAYSDSTFRTYSYCKTSGFELLGRGTYTSSCITQIRHIQLQQQDPTTDSAGIGTGIGIDLLTAATDGYLALWHVDARTSASSDEEKEFTLRSTKRIHQNTIKSLTIEPSSCSVAVAAAAVASVLKPFHLIATVGDDNALAFTIYHDPILLTSSRSRPRTFILREAHAAAITGLASIPRAGNEKENENRRGGGRGFRFVTSGNDQRVKMWDVDIFPEVVEEEGGGGGGGGGGGEAERRHDELGFRLEIRKVGDVFSSVADAGDLLAFFPASSATLDEERERKTRILIVGNGMEVWSLPSVP